MASVLSDLMQLIALGYITSPSDPLINLNTTSSSCLVAMREREREGEGGGDMTKQYCIEYSVFHQK